MIVSATIADTQNRFTKGFFFVVVHFDWAWPSKFQAMLVGGTKSTVMGKTKYKMFN
jgi:hypothetical protein